MQKVEMPLFWNVIDENTFKERTKNVFARVSDVLSRTLGPYGANTIIEKNGEYDVTKDGWSVLKKIHFSDRVEESILSLLINIASQVVIRVGDGSTSSVVASYHLFNYLNEVMEKTNYRPKEIMDEINNVVRKISTIIESDAFKVNTEGDFWEIFNVAMVSTNGNKEIASIIQKIYQETKNPAIEYVKGRTAETTYEIVEGYQSRIGSLDSVFFNTEENTGIYNNLKVLMFDHRIDREHHGDFIQQVINFANAQKQQLLVIAPYFDNPMLEYLRLRTKEETRNRMEFGMIVGRAELIRAIDSHMYADLSSLLGAQIVTESDMYEYNETEWKDTGAVDNNGNAIREAVRKNVVNPVSFAGSVDRIVLGASKTLFQGFPDAIEEVVNLHRVDATNKFKEIEERDRENNIVNHDLIEARNRLSKLSCKMGVINVGGLSNMERGAEFDLVDDAVKACESAYHHGFNPGGNIAIQKAINKLIDSGEINLYQANIVDALSNAFKDVFRTVIRNWDATKAEGEAFEEIFNKSVEKGVPFDIIKNNYSVDVINPAYTDIEILKGAASIISLILSSNQYISTNAEFMVNPEKLGLPKL